MEKLKNSMITILSLAFAVWSNISTPLILLLLTNIIDIITGIWKSLYLKKKISGRKMLWGIIKKISMYLIIICGFIIDSLISYTVENFGISMSTNSIVGSLLGIWLVLDELLSILCNLALLKIPIPNFFYKFIKNLQEKIDEKALT